MSAREVPPPRDAPTAPTAGAGGAAGAPSPTAGKPPGRAGRNLPAAIVVGVSLGALVVATLYTVRWAFVGVVVVAIGFGLHELIRAISVIGAHPPRLPLLAGGTALLVAAYASGSQALVLGLFATVVGCLAWRLTESRPGLLPDVATSAFAVVYVPFLAGFCLLLAIPPDGPRRVTVFIATTVCSDVGGYAAGVLFGRHPMARTVSPKKSWEGFAGSVVACVLAGVAFLIFFLPGTWWQGVLFGLAVVCTATLGDLGESMIKRDIGIKDMGALLPGHGGLMDRLDSLLPTAPIAFLLLTAFVPAPG